MIEPAVRSLIEEAARMAGRKAVPVTSDQLPNSEPLVLEHGDIEDLEQDDSHVAMSDARVAVPEHSHVGESKSNGLAERAVRTWEEQFSTQACSRTTIEGRQSR